MASQPAPATKAGPTILGVDLRRRIVALVNGLGRGLYIKVVFRGTRAYTDGRMIVLPAIRDLAEIPYPTARALIGYAIHEVAHIRYTDFTQVARAFEAGKLVKKFENAMEDYRIEREMTKQFIGTASDLTALRVAIHPKVAAFAPCWYADPRACGPLALTWTGSRINGFANPGIQPSLDAMPPGVHSLIMSWTDRMRGVQTTEEVVDLAIIFEREAIEYAELTRQIPPAANDSDPEPEEDKPDDQDDAALQNAADQPDQDPAAQDDADSDDQNDADSDDSENGDDADDADDQGGQDQDDQGGPNMGGVDDGAEDGESQPGDGKDDNAGNGDSDRDGDGEADSDAAESDAKDGANSSQGDPDGVPEISTGGAGEDGDEEDSSNEPSTSDEGQPGDDQPADSGQDAPSSPDQQSGSSKPGDAGGNPSPDAPQSDVPSGDSGNSAADPASAPPSATGNGGAAGDAADQDSPPEAGQGDATKPEPANDGDVEADGADPVPAPGDGAGEPRDDEQSDDPTPSAGDGPPKTAEQEAADDPQPDGLDSDDPFKDVLDENAQLTDLIDDIMEQIAEQDALPEEAPDAVDGEVDPGQVIKDVKKANAAAPNYTSDAGTQPDDEESDEAARPEASKHHYDDARFSQVEIVAEGCQFETLRSHAGGVISNTARTVKRLLMAEDQRGVVRNRRSGQFDIRNMSAIVGNTGTCYKKSWEKPSPTTLLATLIDFSGSMNHGYLPDGTAAPIPPITLAMMGAMAIEQAVLNTPVNTAMYSYTGYSPHVQLSIFKEGKQSSSQTRRRIGSYHGVSKGCTPTGEAMAALALRLDQAEEDRKVMLVLTDGDADDMDLCASVTRMLIRRGIEVIAIGINNDSVLQWAPVAHVIHDISQLPEALLATIDPRNAKKANRESNARRLAA